MKTLNAGSILTVFLVATFAGPGIVIACHFVMEGSLAKKQTPSPIQLAPVANRPVDVY